MRHNISSMPKIFRTHYCFMHDALHPQTKQARLPSSQTSMMLKIVMNLFLIITKIRASPTIIIFFSKTCCLPSPQISIRRGKSLSPRVSYFFLPKMKKNWPHKISPAISSAAPNPTAPYPSLSCCRLSPAPDRRPPFQFLPCESSHGWHKP